MRVHLTIGTGCCSWGASALHTGSPHLHLPACSRPCVVLSGACWCWEQSWQPCSKQWWAHTPSPCKARVTWGLAWTPRDYQAPFTSLHLLNRTPDSGNRGARAFLQSLYSLQCWSAQFFLGSTSAIFIGDVCLGACTRKGTCPKSTGTNKDEVCCAAPTVTVGSTVHSWGTPLTSRPTGQGKNPGGGRSWICSVGKFKF